MSDVHDGEAAASETNASNTATAANEPKDRIEHVVLLLMENHSFDQMLGCLDTVHAGLDGIRNAASKSNDDGQGHTFLPKATQERQMQHDPDHGHKAVLAQIAGNNSGFVRSFVSDYPKSTLAARQDIMGYYPHGFLPALHALGEQFTVCDKWFSSLPGPTWPNRYFALTGTSMGEVEMPVGLDALNPRWYTEQNQDTIFDRLNDGEKTWKIYFYDFPASLLLKNQRHEKNLVNYRRFDTFFDDAAGPANEFPAFVLIEPKYFGEAQNDDHPPHNIMKAEKLIADTYNALRSNQALWETTLLVILYDEHGGFFDHVPPPSNAVAPDEHTDNFPFTQLGVRVPAILVSPWCDAGVCHTQFDHCSLLKYLCDKWKLGPLGNRTQAAASIGVAIRSTGLARTDTVPFIRVTNQSLIAEHVELERKSSNSNQHGLHHFADHLHEELDKLTADLVDSASQPALTETGWVRLKSALGSAMMRFGQWLSQDFYQARDDREARTGQAFTRLMQSAQVPATTPKDGAPVAAPRS
ncbi:phospholipase C [Paraburkholderia sp. BL23I1N1]|uniref:alkaline phosphatase family protein n=1 Tax=Paraburkholderia sp. BL23I1N1 TaxID=1938802 RepID=UPI000E75F136|nr:alkaline phosphatase family protein [Paraburkholderia sp. BL23I1N1]RKE37785.1 phospholipase C [Paraburkholderia sp. BL23I1N1]